jgi:hypothetical protein
MNQQFANQDMNSDAYMAQNDKSSELYSNDLVLTPSWAQGKMII